MLKQKTIMDQLRFEVRDDAKSDLGAINGELQFHDLAFVLPEVIL